MEHISPTLDGLLKDNRLRQGIADYQVFSRWPAIVGKPLCDWTRPLKVVDGVLWIHAQNSTLLHHLTYVAPKMCARIRAEAPGTSIQRLRFTLREREQ